MKNTKDTNWFIFINANFPRPVMAAHTHLADAGTRVRTLNREQRPVATEGEIAATSSAERC